MQLWVLAKDNGVPTLSPDQSSAFHIVTVWPPVCPMALRKGALDPPVGPPALAQALPSPPHPCLTCLSHLFLALRHPLTFSKLAQLTQVELETPQQVMGFTGRLFSSRAVTLWTAVQHWVSHLVETPGASHSVLE